MKTLLLQYIHYNAWANEKLARFLTGIDPQLLDRELKSSMPTIRKTALHVYDAQFIWLERMHGRSLADWPSKTLAPELAFDELVKHSKLFIAEMESRDESFFESVCSYQNLKGDTFSTPVSGIIMHCMNHGTFHRGQIVTMLREVGVTEGIPQTDYIAYLRV